MSYRPSTVLGAGYLYHCSPTHRRYYQELVKMGARVDMIEYLAAHFSGDPEYLGETSRSLGSLPSSLHSYEYMIGSVERPKPATVRRLQRMTEISNCQYIGEHVGMVGTTDDYSGTFLQPFGSDEQTQVFVDNLRTARSDFNCPLIIENQPQEFSQIGLRTVCEQVRDIAIGADTGILLSFGNILMSEAFHPQDRESELAIIPPDRIWEVHVPLGCAAELAQPTAAKARADEQWAHSMLEQLCKNPDFDPIAIIFEIEASGTPSIAEPERTREMLDWARELLSSTRGTDKAK